MSIDFNPLYIFPFINKGHIVSDLFFISGFNESHKLLLSISFRYALNSFDIITVDESKFKLTNYKVESTLLLISTKNQFRSLLL